MPSHRLSNAYEDIKYALGIAFDMGFTIRRDCPTLRPEPCVVNREGLGQIAGGVFMLGRPEWIFGPAKIVEIQHGHNKGKFIQSTRINMSEITLYLPPERMDGKICRLGSGLISWEKSWLFEPEHVMRESPTEMGSVYEELFKRIDTRRRIRGGKQTYAVLPEAWKKLNDCSALPPYEYIDWPQ